MTFVRRNSLPAPSRTISSPSPVATSVSPPLPAAVSGAAPFARYFQLGLPAGAARLSDDTEPSAQAVTICEPSLEILAEVTPRSGTRINSPPRATASRLRKAYRAVLPFGDS